MKMPMMRYLITGLLLIPWLGPALAQSGNPGFTGQNVGTPITATTGGATGTLPPGPSVVATNVGSVGAYCQPGASASTSSQYLGPVGGGFQFQIIPGTTQLTCITASGTTTVNLVGGSGFARTQPAPGIPSSGGTVTSVYGTISVKSGTTYTAAGTDCGTTLLFTSNSPVTVTLPSSIAPLSGVGCIIAVIQGGTAKVSVNGSAVSPASLVSANSYTGTSGTSGAIVDLVLTTVASTATAYLTGTGS